MTFYNTILIPRCFRLLSHNFIKVNTLRGPLLQFWPKNHFSDFCSNWKQIYRSFCFCIAWVHFSPTHCPSNEEINKGLVFWLSADFSKIVDLKISQFPPLSKHLNLGQNRPIYVLKALFLRNSFMQLYFYYGLPVSRYIQLFYTTFCAWKTKNICLPIFWNLIGCWAKLKFLIGCWSHMTGIMADI